MFLARLHLNRSRMAVLWQSNPYRVHQRLRMAYPNELRLLFRIEDPPDDRATQILVQSHTAPNWSAFDDFPVLAHTPEHKPFDPRLEAGRHYRFRLLGNPTMKTKNAEGRKVRLALLREDDQRKWLTRKLNEAGAEAIGLMIAPRGLQRSRKNSQNDESIQTHSAVLFEGILHVTDPIALRAALEAGIGSAKGYGFGLLSIAPA